MEESDMEIEDIIKTITEETEMDVSIMKVPTIQILGEQKEEISKLFRDLSELVPAKDTAHDKIQRDIVSMETELLSKGEINPILLINATEIIRSILGYLTNQVEQPEMKLHKLLLIEYVEGQKPTHITFAKNLIESINFGIKTEIVYKKWAQISMHIIEKNVTTHPLQN